jgi:hypothetical protein
VVGREAMDATSRKERREKKTLNVLSDRRPIPLIRAYIRSTLYKGGIKAAAWEGQGEEADDTHAQ